MSTLQWALPDTPDDVFWSPESALLLLVRVTKKGLHVHIRSKLGRFQVVLASTTGSLVEVEAQILPWAISSAVVQYVVRYGKVG